MADLAEVAAGAMDAEMLGILLICGGILGLAAFRFRRRSLL